MSEASSKDWPEKDSEQTIYLTIILYTERKVRCKIVSGFGTRRHKFEYEDLARIAKERGTGISDVRSELEGLAGEGF